MKRPARNHQPQVREKYITTSFGAIPVADVKRAILAAFAISAGIEAMCVGIWAETWL